MELPEINKTYNYFDDGKIRESRRAKATIIEIIPFNEATEDMIMIWQDEAMDNNSLYAKETDYFIVALIKKLNIELIFARTINGGWFSFNDSWWDGRLDVDGSLTKLMKEYQES